MSNIKYNITLAETGDSFLCGEDQFIFDAMNRNGIKKHGCCGGGCGICKMKLSSGELNFAKKMSRAHISQQEEQAGYVLTCCVKPKSDVVLFADIKQQCATG